MMARKIAGNIVKCLESLGFIEGEPN